MSKRKVRMASATGSRGPAPKSHQITGEFRDPAERAGGIPWLVPWGTDYRNLETDLGARRHIDRTGRPDGVPWAVTGMADGGAVASPIDALRESLELAAADQTGGKGSVTARDIASMLPVTGNAMSAYEAGQSGKAAYDAARAGDWRGAAGNAALTGLNVAGALSPLPWSNLAGRVAKDAGRTAAVFAPAPSNSEKTAKAFMMRADGRDNRDIYRETGRVFGPDGKLRVELPDHNMMKIKDVSAKPGEIRNLGDMIDHPKVFERFPELRNKGVTFTDFQNFDPQLNKITGVAGSNDRLGAHMTAGMPERWYREQFPKMIQYDVVTKGNFGGAIGHTIEGALKQYDDAVRVAQEIIDNPRPGEDVKAAAAYIEKLTPMRDRMAAFMAGELDTKQRGKIKKDVAGRTSGNIEARMVRKRALASPQDFKNWGPYPYAIEMPSQWENVKVIPRNHADRGAVSDLINSWQHWGAGRFARGGRVGAALKRAKAKTGGVTVGAMSGATPGRADALSVQVPQGAYVVPADVVAALGDGNNAAGLAKLKSRFPHRRGTAKTYARGGAVPILISDGEYVIDPAVVSELGGGDVNYGHDILDNFVTNVRSEYAQHLKNLPGPNA